MIEHQHWHPVAPLEAIHTQPHPARLLAHDLVLWRDATGARHAWPERCPHRGAKLSMGRVAGGRLECPYHGWQFAPSGQCVHVPALPAFTPPDTHCVQTFDVDYRVEETASGLRATQCKAWQPQSNLHSTEKLRAFQDTIFRPDQPVLESQQPKGLPLDLRAELHTRADRASSAYRRYLSRQGITFGTC